MTLAEIFTSIRARWITALVVFLLVVVSVAVFTFTRKPMYTANAAVLLDVKTPDPIAGVVLGGTSYMATQLNVIQSERVVMRAIQALGLDQDADRKRIWLALTGGVGDFKSWLSDGILSRLDAVPTRDSNVISVVFTSPDPDFAAAVPNAIVKAYIETTLELRVEPAKLYSGFFDTRSKQLREDLERAQSKLSSFQQSKGIIATDERLDVETLRLSELTSQMVVLQGVANESGGRQSQSTANTSQMQEVLGSPLLTSQATELARNQARLTELSARFGDNHPEMIELRAKIAQQRAQLDADTSRVVGSLNVNNEVNQTRLGQLRAAVAEQRNKLLQLKVQRDEAAVLVRDVENAQRAFDTVASRANQTSMESQTTQTNVSVLKQAWTPSIPSSPRTTLYMVVSVLVGGFLGLAAALAREMADRRLRTNREVTRLLHQPLLGVLPAKARAKPASQLRLRMTAGITGKQRA